MIRTASMRTARKPFLSLVALLGLSAATLLSAESPDSADELAWTADLRYRFEWVDEDSFDERAQASTLRTRVGLRTPRAGGVQGFAEVSDVRAIGPDDYNAGAGATPDRTAFPVVADPRDRRLNQAWLSWRAAEGLELTAGRQRIKLDNDRFVGNVGWRQNEQTYDATTLRIQRGDWQAFYGWIDRVNRIFDTDTAAGRHDHRSHLFQLGRAITVGHRLTAYVYHIDNREQPGLSNRTAGLRYTGESAAAAWPLSWQFEGALQHEAGRAPKDYNAHYLHARLEASPNELFQPLAGFERLSGNQRPGEAFRTPLATLHAFNGWADRFLATPDRGLDDWYAGFKGGAGRLGWQLVAHHFGAEDGGGDFGDEIDASLNLRLNESVSLLIKAARFDADAANFRSVTKFWTMLSWTLP